MRYLVISDIHANWEALEAVIHDAGNRYEKILCCGDLIGYGADPNAVVDWARNNVHAIVRGNHDKAGVDLAELEWFNPVAQIATVWTHEALTPDRLDYVKNLPAGPTVIDDFAMVHGSPLNEDEYLVTVAEATEAFAYSPATVVLFGHTHLQGGFEKQRKVWKLDSSSNPTVLGLNPDSAYLINPGSVGQPRDGNPEAAYALFDTEERTICYHRTPYDMEKAQRKIRQAGLPPVLADRLSHGL